ncbi:MAG: 2-amino-4-hydroxy-6-hydroxymethyldihydropteridine diphosphokinase [Cyanobium sp.]
MALARPATTARAPEPLERVAIALGSNLGDSRATLERALEALDRIEGVRLIRRSSWYRSAPIGPVQPHFINGCALLEVSLAPETLLEVLQAIENRFGRRRAERWGPRTLDLDLILFGTQRISTERLEVPHPRMVERAFVLVPLAEIAATWIDPLSGRSVAELAAALPAELKGGDALAALEPKGPHRAVGRLSRHP